MKGTKFMMVVSVAVAIVGGGCDLEPDMAVPSSDVGMVSFSFESPAITGSIDNYYKTVGVVAPIGTDLTHLVPVIKVADGATVSPASGVPLNFSVPVTYTVTAENGMTRKYTVVVGIPDKPIKICGYQNGDVIGMTFGASTNDSIAVYIFVYSGWWTKPGFSYPLTEIQPNGVWICDVTTGGLDDYASEVIAFLIPGTMSVPPADGGGVPNLSYPLAVLYR